LLQRITTKKITPKKDGDEEVSKKYAKGSCKGTEK
jgi:hypothetical protein